MIDILIKKWQDEHAKLLAEYSSYVKLSENEALFLRSEMAKVLQFIEDLKNLKLAVNKVKEFLKK